MFICSTSAYSIPTAAYTHPHAAGTVYYPRKAPCLHTDFCGQIVSMGRSDTMSYETSPPSAHRYEPESRRHCAAHLHVRDSSNGCRSSYKFAPCGIECYTAQASKVTSALSGIKLHMLYINQVFYTNPDKTILISSHTVHAHNVRLAYSPTDCKPNRSEPEQTAYRTVPNLNGLQRRLSMFQSVRL